MSIQLPEEESTIEIQESSQDIDPLASAKKLSGSPFFLGYSFIIFFGLLYFFGWSTAGSYYSNFGAGWLNYWLTPWQFFKFSLVSFGLLFFVLLIFKGFIFKKPASSNDDDSPVVIKNTQRTVAIFGLILSGMNYLIYLRFELSLTVNLLIVGLCLFLIVQMLKEFFYEYAKVSKFIVSEICFLGILGFLVFPHYLGGALGGYYSHDLQNYPMVRTEKRQKTEKPFFLFKNKSHAFVAMYKKSGPPYEIKAVHLEDVEYIQPSTWFGVIKIDSFYEAGVVRTDQKNITEITKKTLRKDPTNLPGLPSGPVLTPQGQASTSTENAIRLVDGIIDPTSLWETYQKGGWWKYDFGEGTTKTIIAYKLYGWDSLANGPKSWFLEGSNDDTAWTTLSHQKNVSWEDMEVKHVIINKPKAYRYYRLTIPPAKIPGLQRLMEMEFLEK